MSINDVCACGDYRLHHPNNGPCLANNMGLGCGCSQFSLACTDADMRASEAAHARYAASERRARAKAGIDEEGWWKP